MKNRPATKAELEQLRGASEQWWVPHALIWIEGPGWGYRTYVKGQDVTHLKKPPLTPKPEVKHADHA